MDRRVAPTLLIAAWLALAGGALAWRHQWLQPRLADTGPQALARDGRGGILLATARELLHLDTRGRVLDRRPADALGMTRIAALAQGEGSTLWAYDDARGELFRCDNRRWACQALPGARLAGDVQLAWLFGPWRRLLVSDTTGQRMLAFTEDGSALTVPGFAWTAPTQLLGSGTSPLLAEAGRRRIVELDALANRPGRELLVTVQTPWRFVRREAQWWVLEAETRLQRARLRHYAGAASSEIPMGAVDAVALLDVGQDLIVASRDDWRLMALDPESDAAFSFGEPALRAEFRARRAAHAAARHETAWLPWLAALLLGPALLALPVVWWPRRHTAATVPAPAPTVAGVAPLWRRGRLLLGGAVILLAMFKLWFLAAPAGAPVLRHFLP